MKSYLNKYTLKHYVIIFKISRFILKLTGHSQFLGTFVIDFMKHFHFVLIATVNNCLKSEGRNNKLSTNIKKKTFVSKNNKKNSIAIMMRLEIKQIFLFAGNILYDY